MLWQLAFAACLAIGSLCQTAPPPSGLPADAAGQEEPLEGIWPTPRMVELWVQRTALDVADRYDLSDEQYQRLEARMMERWPRFLEENRRQLQPLVNEWFEFQMAVEPVPPERVQRWAERAAPMFDRMQQHVDAGADEIRTMLEPEQRARFEAETAKLKAGMAMFGQKLRTWRQGEIAEHEFGHPRRRHSRAVGGRQTTRPAESRRPDPIKQELDAWDRYVAEFIERYHLTGAQRTAGLSILVEVKERARAHRDRHRQDIAELERSIAAREPDSAGDLEEQVRRLYGPIDALFSELKTRLEGLLTAAQRDATTRPAE